MPYETYSTDIRLFRRSIRAMLLLFFLWPGLHIGCRTDSDVPLWPLLEAPARNHFFFSVPDAAPGSAEKHRARNELTALIDAARNEILIWCYGFDERQVIAALIRARGRGVRIELHGSPESDYSALQQAGFEPAIRNRSGLQHAKLFLIDGSMLYSGTGNFTKSGFYYNHNAFFYLPITPATARTITTAMRTETADRPQWIPVPFGGRMLIGPHQGRLMQMVLLDSVERSQSNIDFLIFSHTDAVLTAGMYRAALRGVTISGVFDDEYNRGELPDEAARLNRGLGATAARIYSEGNRNVFYEHAIAHGGHLHHKTLIIDNRKVLTGSYNWSLSARDRNQEILFQFEDPFVARLFQQEHARIVNNARLHPRAPLNDSLEIPNVQIRDEHICLPAQYAPPQYNQTLTVFSGREAYSRVAHYDLTRIPTQAIVSDNDAWCFPITESQNTSSGSSHGRYYQIAPLSAQYNRAVFAPGYAADVRATDQPALPCAHKYCRAITPRMLRTDQGILWLNEPIATELELRMLDRNGWHPTITATHIQGGVYQFTPQSVSGDVLLTLHASVTGKNSQTYLACLQNGATLDTSIRTFLEALHWFDGPSVACQINVLQ
ncbi:MAG: hypothetical protein KDK30_12260 [Leptospiraceae bacterium]|nr:hypothetical protein [Leptospiraceae bacterium]